MVVQWLRLHLPGQGTWVQSLVWEDSTCLGATKPMHCNCPEPVLYNKRSHLNEKPLYSNEDSVQPKTNKLKRNTSS